MKILLKKIKELPDARHPHNIGEGFEIELNTLGKEKPTVGERFPLTTYWSTSIVTEILSKHKFKTLNSIYTWKEIK